jgi:hypothetical protein
MNPNPRSFLVHEEFLETGFEQRFQSVLSYAQHHRTWHIISAVPGSGKSLGIADIFLHCGGKKEDTGKIVMPIVAIRAPKNAHGELSLGTALSLTFGISVRMPWHQRRIWLADMMALAEVEEIIIDDAQDLTLEQLTYLKELTDNLEAPPHGRRVGLCLVTATSGKSIPFLETFARPDTLWRQFRRRLDKERRFISVLGHTKEEVRDILLTYEELYRPQFPALQLGIWANSITEWLTHPVLDPDGAKRVTMDHLASLVTISLRSIYQQGQSSVDGGLLKQTAERMILHRDDVALLSSPIDFQETGG